jgi:hypothetical protein
MARAHCKEHTKIGKKMGEKERMYIIFTHCEKMKEWHP